MPLTPAEKKLGTAIGFDQQVCELVKQQTGGKLQRLTALTDERQEFTADGLSVPVERTEVGPAIEKLQPHLARLGYRAFWSEIYDSRGAKTSDVLAVLKTTDDFAILSIRRPCGGNYDISVDDVIERLKSWRTVCQFQIVGAAGDWVAIEFDSLPKNVCAFAEEIYEFCPDAVEQGVGLAKESDDPALFKAARKLFPRLSIKMQNKLDKQAAEFAKMELPPQLAKMLESHSFSFDTPTDMGIRLLAYDLNQNKRLFLWWD